jgi:hypothetical protein
MLSKAFGIKLSAALREEIQEETLAMEVEVVEAVAEQAVQQTNKWYPPEET